MGRKLVTVRKVSAIEPISGADMIEVAIVDGWTCIVKKNEFAVNESAVFFEIDSFLPAADERWAFLVNKFINWNDREGFRVKSMKMKGQISQGLLQPLHRFPEISEVITELEAKHGETQAGQMVRELCFADILLVTKWEALENNAALQNHGPSRPIPFFIQKTDQERCQNLPDVFKQWQAGIFQETTKMDGSSMTAYFVRNDSRWMEKLESVDVAKEPTAAQPNGRFGVCSKNVDIEEAAGVGHFWDVAKSNGLPQKLAKLDRNIAIQGELCGSSIQKNFEGFPPNFHEFFLFSAWDIDQQKYVKPKDAEELAKQLGIKHVQVNGYFRLGDIATSVQDLLNRAEGKGINGRKREGIVLKHVDGEFSFKAISNSYLLKHGE